MPQIERQISRADLRRALSSERESYVVCTLVAVSEKARAQRWVQKAPYTKQSGVGT